VARDPFPEDIARTLADLVPPAPRPDAVYALVFDAAGQAQWTDGAQRLLGPQERDRAARFRFGHDRTTYVVAHALWRGLLGRCLGIAPADVPLRFAASGQPQLPGTGWVTSLSHSGTLVMLAASRAAALGVDLERAPSSARLRALAGEICAPDELDSLRGVPEAAREQALLRLWTRKEALLKAAGLGLVCPPSSFSAPVGVPVALPGATTPSCVVRDLTPVQGWVAAWAAPPDTEELVWQWFGSRMT
jgi:4'-phosphopantetheinyl transferase